jgi:hypothetical protein
MWFDVVLDLKTQVQIEVVIINSSRELFPASVDEAALSGNGDLDAFLGQGRPRTGVGRSVPARRCETQNDDSYFGTVMPFHDASPDVETQQLSCRSLAPHETWVSAQWTPRSRNISLILGKISLGPATWRRRYREHRRGEFGQGDIYRSAKVRAILGP